MAEALHLQSGVRVLRVFERKTDKMQGVPVRGREYVHGLRALQQRERQFTVERRLRIERLAGYVKRVHFMRGLHLERTGIAEGFDFNGFCRCGRAYKAQGHPKYYFSFHILKNRAFVFSTWSAVFEIRPSVFSPKDAVKVKHTTVVL